MEVSKEIFKKIHHFKKKWQLQMKEVPAVSSQCNTIHKSQDVEPT